MVILVLLTCVVVFTFYYVIGNVITQLYYGVCNIPTLVVLTWPVILPKAIKKAIRNYREFTAIYKEDE